MAILTTNAGSLWLTVMGKLLVTLASSVETLSTRKILKYSTLHGSFHKQDLLKTKFYETSKKFY